MPALVFVTLTCFTGLGFHAARDWHHHGELGAGFFHIHFHVGDHEHGDLEHDDHPHHQAGPERETPDGPDHRPPRRHAVLTINHAYQHFAPKASVTAAAGRSPKHAATVELFVTWDSDLVRVAQPRAPPA